MAHNEVDDVLDHLKMIKNGSDLDVDKVNEIEILQVELRFLRTFIKYHHVLLPNSAFKIQKKEQLIRRILGSVYIRDECKIDFNVERVVSELLEFSECDTNSRCKFRLNGSYLSEFMECLDENLNDVPRYLVRSDPFLTKEIKILQKTDRFLKQVKIIQKKMKFLRYLYAMEIRSYVDHEKLEGLETRIQLMAYSVGQFCLALWVNEDVDDTNSYKDECNTYRDKENDDTDAHEDDGSTDPCENGDNIDPYEDEDTDPHGDDADTDPHADDDDTDPHEDDTHHEKLEGLKTRIQLWLALWTNEDEVNTADIESKPPYLLCLIVLVQLEMQKIFLGELNASKFSLSRTFKNQKFLKCFPHHLYNLLVHLSNKKLENCHINISSRNIDVAIEFLLVFLADVPNSYINGNRLNEVLAKVGALVGDLLSIIQKLFPGSAIEDATSEINLGSIQILEKVENLKMHVEERHYRSIKFIPSQFPTVGGLSFLDSMIKKLNEVKSESGSDFIMKSDHIVLLEKELSSLTSVLRDFAKVHHEHEIYKDFQKRTVSLAYEAEISIDSILVQSNGLWHLFCSLPAIIKELKHIKDEVSKMWSKDLSLKLGFIEEPSKYRPAQHSNAMNGEDIVGFENDTEKIIQYLTRGTDELDVVPIVGMGGQGKTTFARKLYDDEMIVSRFDLRAWCCISQTYSRRGLLQEIFNDVSGNKDKVDKVDELADMLRKRLMCKRYLIVLDDMWDVMAWDDLRLSFPDDKNGSRIVVTTRLEEVGQLVAQHTDPYFLPFLNLEESRELLQKKVFQNEGCPHDLEDASLAVAERCKGLPLVIVLVAGILKQNKMEESWWHEVKNSLLSYLGECEEQSLSTMKLSYDNLPDHLRPCLLYMGMFPEDNKIPASKLIRLWIAEGFVQNIESGRLEEAAESYLNNLVSSNVVMVSKRRYDGKVKYCQVHDVVLHFCLVKSREERFMLAVKGHSIQCQHLDLNETRLCYHTTDHELPEFALLSSKTRKPFQWYIRSLIIYASDWYPIPWITKLRLLKILDLSHFRIFHLSLATLHPLIHLKHLSADANLFDFNPESHLRHLETVIVKTSHRVWLPENFWKMEKLRHVDICYPGSDLCYFETNGTFEVKKFSLNSEEFLKLENLRSLRGVTFEYDDANCVYLLLRRCPKLQELGITILLYEANHEKNWTYNANLEGFTQLQSLNLGIDCIYNYITEFQLPFSLRKLKLRRCDITKSVASMIAKLPSLEYLILHETGFDQKEWCLLDIKFDKLKFLKLRSLNMIRWVASEESFPQLEVLVLKRCYKLEEIPLSFAYIQPLKQIKLTYCFNKSLEASAGKIKEEAEAIEGVDRLHLSVHHGQHSLSSSSSSCSNVDLVGSDDQEDTEKNEHDFEPSLSSGSIGSDDQEDRRK